MTRSEYFERWAELHGGLDPRTSIPVQGWLTVTYVLAKTLVLLRMSPNAVTMLGMLVALSVPYWVVTDRLFVAGVVALVAGLIDNLDGAVAIATGRSSDFGYVLDSVADRVGTRRCWWDWGLPPRPHGRRWRRRVWPSCRSTRGRAPRVLDSPRSA